MRLGISLLTDTPFGDACFGIIEMELLFNDQLSVNPALLISITSPIHSCFRFLCQSTNPSGSYSSLHTQ